MAFTIFKLLLGTQLTQIVGRDHFDIYIIFNAGLQNAKYLKQIWQDYGLLLCLWSNEILSLVIQFSIDLIKLNHQDR